MIWKNNFPKKSNATGIDPVLLVCGFIGGFVSSLAITGRFKKRASVKRTGEDVSGAWTGTKLKAKWDYGKLPKMSEYEDKQVNSELAGDGVFHEKALNMVKHLKDSEHHP